MVGIEMHDSEYFRKARREIEPLVPIGVRRVLDVGCGAGRFGEMLKSIRREVEVWGVELNYLAAKEASSRLDRVIHAAFSDELSLPAEGFDCVVFNDSLEHFPAVEAPLNLAWRLLAPGGYVVVSLPNVRHVENLRHLLVELDWEYGDEGVRDRTHLRFFTKKSAARTIGGAGFEITSITGINKTGWIGWKLRVLMRVLPRLFADIEWLQYVIVARKHKE